MERPFDYPGKSEPTGFDPYQMKSTSQPALRHQYDDFGGHIVNVIMCLAPDWWTDADVARAVALRYEAEHCSHSHDCCGRYYSRGGKVLSITRGHRDEDCESCLLVIVEINHVQNV